MKTIIYFIRHSEPIKVKNLYNNDSMQEKNEKRVLSINGEKRSEVLSNIEELLNLNLVVSSNYARAIDTAKYISEKNDLELFIDERFNERKIGISSWTEYPTDFEVKQFNDENYKFGTGESQKEVRERIYDALEELILYNKGKRIAIVFHSTAIMNILRKWCNEEFDGKIYKVTFNNETIFNCEFKAPELFKLIFGENFNLESIENIRPKELEE